MLYNQLNKTQQLAVDLYEWDGFMHRPQNHGISLTRDECRSEKPKRESTTIYYVTIGNTVRSAGNEDDITMDIERDSVLLSLVMSEIKSFEFTYWRA